MGLAGRARPRKRWSTSRPTASRFRRTPTPRTFSSTSSPARSRARTRRACAATPPQRSSSGCGRRRGTHSSRHTPFGTRPSSHVPRRCSRCCAAIWRRCTGAFQRARLGTWLVIHCVKRASQRMGLLPGPHRLCRRLGRLGVGLGLLGRLGLLALVFSLLAVEFIVLLVLLASSCRLWNESCPLQLEGEPIVSHMPTLRTKESPKG